MNRALLIGIGNTLRGDDGVGIRVAEQARRKFPQLDVECVHGLSPEIADTIAQYTTVFIVDASVATASLRASEVTPAVSGEKIEAHTMSPAGVLGLAQVIYDRIPSHTILIEVPAVACGFSEELSPATAAQVEPSLDIVASYLTRF
jgi:hydrogenase maturation protease